MKKDQNSSRKYVIIGLLIAISILYCGQLLYLQVIDDTYKTQAKTNTIKTLSVDPTRGLIYDRNGKLIVYNDAMYDIMVTPSEVELVDTQEFCNLLNITYSYYCSQMKTASKGLRYYQESAFLKQVSMSDYNRFQEFLYRFPGYYGRVRSIRRHPFKCAAHIVGDIGEVDSSQIKASDFYYTLGDYAGKSGIEAVYDQYLRGARGSKDVFVDKLNRVQGSFNDGINDVTPIAGNDLVSTLDIDLQVYGELLMQNKRGSIVAIEPATGEILAMISSPAFDPNLLCGRNRGHNFNVLNRDTLNPLFNRPIMAQYPPGSTFKALVALVAIGDSAISENYGYTCNGLYHIPGYALKCSHGHTSARCVQDGLRHSCNPYFWQTFRNTIDNNKYDNAAEGYKNWHENVVSFGLGKELNIDIPYEKPGNIPSNDYYNGLYGKKAWGSSTILSLGIGQGEILMTPLQLANLYAVIANEGYYYTPHLVRTIIKDGDYLDNPNIKKNRTKVNRYAFKSVKEGLLEVVNSGTGRRSKIDGIDMCGKTGTAQNPHGEDHSIFAAFAPKENPSIAVAVIVENGGGGSKYAAPITSLMIEKYINDTISDKRLNFEKVILDANLINPNANE